MTRDPAAMRGALEEAMLGPPGQAAADRVCVTCVDLLDIDGAAISLILDEAVMGTIGASDELSRRLDDVQFTVGEGPCLDSVASGRAVLVADLALPTNLRWPAYTSRALELGARAVFALPVGVGGSRFGALDLYRAHAGPLDDANLTGGYLVAEYAARSLVDAAAAMLVPGPDGEAAAGPLTLDRVEVYQATGMVMGALGVTPAEALLRIRGYAFANDLTASEVAWAVVERRLLLTADGDWERHDTPAGPEQL